MIRRFSILTRYKKSVEAKLIAVKEDIDIDRKLKGGQCYHGSMQSNNT